ncbi:MAG: hypothetical protein LAP86_34095 [Acidobacteriia bacterium]|nr:hypothetical protein [Terriglobia bacterium]
MYVQFERRTEASASARLLRPDTGGHIARKYRVALVPLPRDKLQNRLSGVFDHVALHCHNPLGAPRPGFVMLNIVIDLLEGISILWLDAAVRPASRVHSYGELTVNHSGPEVGFGKIAIDVPQASLLIASALPTIQELETE